MRSSSAASTSRRRCRSGRSRTAGTSSCGGRRSRSDAITRPRTPSQTVGPFFSFGLCTRPQNELPGGSVRVGGRVLDGEGAPVPDALVELWNPAAGWGRCGTDGEGRFSFLVPAGAGRFEVLVFARGLLKPALTRLYLDGGAPEDPSMAARREGDRYRFDVRLQGEHATAFFEL